MGESICETYAFQARSSRTSLPPSLVGDPIAVFELLPGEVTIELPSVDTFPAMLTVNPALFLHKKRHEGDKLTE